jgi:hypothetical protein
MVGNGEPYLSLFPNSSLTHLKSNTLKRVAMHEESSDPIAYIEQDAFSHHPSNPFELPAEDASSDPILLTPSKGKSKRDKLKTQAVKEEGDAMGQPGPGPDSTIQTTPQEEQEGSADLDETQGVEQAMEGEYVEDETMEDDEPVADYELSEGDFREHTSDEYFTLDLKSPEEQVEIEEEIEDLLQKVPQLAEDYELLDRLGTGVAVPFNVLRPLRSDHFPPQELSPPYTKPLISTTTRNGITRSGTASTLRIHLHGTSHSHVSLGSLRLLPSSASLSPPLQDE